MLLVIISWDKKAHEVQPEGSLKKGTEQSVFPSPVTSFFLPFSKSKNKYNFLFECC